MEKMTSFHKLLAVFWVVVGLAVPSTAYIIAHATEHNSNHGSHLVSRTETFSYTP